LMRANAIGKTIKARLEQYTLRNDMVPIAAIRGPGAMVGFEIMATRGTVEPDAEATKRVTTAALKHGLILLSCGVYNNTIRILVPLTAEEHILNEGLDLLGEALKDAVIAS
jgi:4-aminobutyrate aminotransferase / (S)-3-amino-2-methylpropionate transaminase / 5-aminovalerate transaminase